MVDITSSIDKALELKKRFEKKEKVLNHQIDGEAYILSPSYKWKEIVLNNFNRVKRKEITIEELLKLLQDQGVVFGQKESLVKYPVLGCLHFIAKLSNTSLDI